MAILTSSQSLASMGLTKNSLLKGDYAFTGTYHCLDADSDGVNSSGQPVNAQNSNLATIVISGVMTFDGAGTSTQKGNFVETVSLGSPLDITFIPSVDYGPFAIAASPYSVGFDGSVRVTPGVTTFTSTDDNRITGSAALVSGMFSGKLSRNGSLVLTTAVPLVQNLAIFFEGSQVALIPRQCSVTMTLTP